MCRKLICFLTLAHFFIGYTPASAQSTEERFQDLFTTAGYATAFGAALGAAALSFKKYPDQHLRYVAVGASLGFIGGSALGTYIIFSPMLMSKQSLNQLDIAAMPASAKNKSVKVIPAIDIESKKLTGLYASWNVMSF